MSLRRLLSASLGVISPMVTSAATDCFDPANYDSSDVITRDIAIIGGGSSGTYSAINLRELGQSVVVVEREDVLGGHTNTYTDPSTGLTVDFGVQDYLNSSVTLEYFAHFNISLVSPSASSTYLPVDFTTGDILSTFAGSTDLTEWAAQIAKYPWLDQTWEVPQPVDEDLLLPFGDFITKYNLSDVAYDLYLSSQGLSDPLQHSTVDVMKMVDPAYLDEVSGAALATENLDNSELYVKALAELGADALLSSTVTSAQRAADGAGISLVISTPSGSKLVQASKLLITIPPVLENMEPFELDTKESDIFSQFDYMGYYTLIFNNTGLPSGFTWINANSSTATYNIPETPADTQIIGSRVSDLFYAWYRSPADVAQTKVESDTIETVQKLQATYNLAVTTPTILEFRSHTPYKLTVSPDAISNGFYDDLYSLQGYRNTWYTGAAFISHNCGVIWNFTQALLPEIVAA